MGEVSLYTHHIRADSVYSIYAKIRFSGEGGGRTDKVKPLLKAGDLRLKTMSRGSQPSHFGSHLVAPGEGGGRADKVKPLLAATRSTAGSRDTNHKKL